MIRLGICIIAAGIAILLIPLGTVGAMVGLLLVGLGCAPIYPCVIHSTPYHFGADKSQALIGIQMASAYVGTAVMPPLFGLIANHISISLLGVYLLLILLIMTLFHRRMISKCDQK